MTEEEDEKEFCDSVAFTLTQAIRVGFMSSLLEKTDARTLAQACNRLSDPALHRLVAIATACFNDRTEISKG